MLIRYNGFLWVSVISEEKLEKIQKSDDITLDEPYIMGPSVRMRVNIGHLEQLVVFVFKVNNGGDINNYILSCLVGLFEINEQQYVLK